MVRSHVRPKFATRLCRHVVVFAPAGRPTQTMPPAPPHAALQSPPSEDILHSTPALPHAASTGSAGGGGDGGARGGGAGGACWQGQKR